MSPMGRKLLEAAEFSEDGMMYSGISVDYNVALNDYWTHLCDMSRVSR